MKKKSGPKSKSVETGRLCKKCNGPIVRRPGGNTQCRDCHRRRAREHDKKNPELHKGYRRKYVRDSKSAVIKGYGGKCKCCGESRYEFLTIDHINNDGMQYRQKSVGYRRAGTGFYRWIIANGFPMDLRLLCMNCNFARGRYGYCPHEKERQEASKMKEDCGTTNGCS